MLRTFGTLMVAVCCSWANSSGAAEGPGSGDAFVLRPGVIIESRGGLVFLMSPENAVEAVHLKSGETEWVSPHASKPLALSENLLVGQVDATTVGVLELVTLNVADRGELVEQFRIKLPSDVFGSIDADRNRAFEALAAYRGRNVYVRWLQRTVSIPARPQATTAPDTKDGVFLLNTQTGNVVEVDKSQAPLTTLVQRPALSAQEKLPGVRDSQFRSADDKHVLVSRRTANNNVWDKYQWEVIDRKSGDVVGKHKHFRKYAPFAVIGGLLIYESSPYSRRVNDELVASPLQIRTVNLENGELLWQREIRDTSYDGPVPP